MDDSALLTRLAAFDTTVVSDALDALGLPGGLASLRPVWGAPRIVGRARTITLEPVARPRDAPQSGPHLATGVIATAAPGDVIVIGTRAGGRGTDASSWGGILSLGAVRRGVAGVVTDGACRDVGEARALGLPVFSRGTTPRTARGRLRQIAAGARVRLDAPERRGPERGGADVDDGDLVIADDSGVAVIPLARAAEVLAEAEAIAAREARITAEVRSGVPLDVAMRDDRLAGREPTDPPAVGRDDPADATGIPWPAALSTLPTATLSDALDRLGLPGSLHGIGPLRTGQRACGPAYTVGYERIDEPGAGRGGTVGDFLDDVPPGSVVVIDNAGRTDATVWGGIMTRVAARRGVAATVVHGVCRDVDTALSSGYPIWSAGRFLRTGKDRVALRAVQEPLRIDGVTIRPGDLVCADEDGVVVVPRDRQSDVAATAARIEAAERSILAAVEGGARLADARAAHGYHHLQTAAGSGDAS